MVKHVLISCVREEKKKKNQWILYIKKSSFFEFRDKDIIEFLRHKLYYIISDPSEKKVSLFYHCFLLLSCQIVSDIVSDNLAIPCTVGCQATLSVGFPRQEYWMGWHFLFQEIFLIRDWKGVSCIVGRFLTTQPPGERISQAGRPGVSKWRK